MWRVLPKPWRHATFAFLIAPMPRIKHLLAIAALTLLTATGSAQNSILDTPTDINTAGKTLKQIITEIEAGSEVRFSYSDNLLPKKQFNAVDRRQTLGRLLDNLLHSNGIDYKIVNGQIVLFKSASDGNNCLISGFLVDKKSSESVINGSVYVADIGIGTTSNSYGFFTTELPEGRHHLKFNSLGYMPADTILNISGTHNLVFRLEPVSYQMSEIVVKENGGSDFMESAMNTIAKLNIEQLKQMPNVLGEHDALRNLDMLTGLQISEFSTSNISVRGGTGDQTIFMMDEANLHTASHLGGFSSVFNPDVVNHIKIYKNELPVSESGALSSFIDVRLRDGDMQHWHTSGSIGLLTVRATVEGPLKKDKSSVLLTVRRTYADQLLNNFFKNHNFALQFYYYDVNFKFNYKFNPHNRLYISWYSGSDKLDHSMYLKRKDHISTIRWNHIFGENLFFNLSAIGSYNSTRLLNFHNYGALNWQSICWNTKMKLDFSHYVSDRISLKYGILGSYYSLEPFDLSPEEGETAYRKSRIHAQTIMNHGIYVDETLKFGASLSLELGARLNVHFGPTDYQNSGDSTIIYPEWNTTLNCRATDRLLLKLNASSRSQPLHQMQVSSYGITINRWMPANSRFLPEHSLNLSVSADYEISEWLNASADIYCRKLKNLIETMQEMRLVYEINPEKYARHSSADVVGCEVSAIATFDNLKMSVSYDYTNSRWLTQGLNNGKSYPASFIRKHTVRIAGTYALNGHIRLSASWQIASGMPYTAAVGKYVIDGKTTLQFDDNQINTMRLPNYNRLDISMNIENKKNKIRRWKSYWDFAIYNVYARKNPLGVAYFTTDEKGTYVLKPGYYYFYQFVPSVSYRFRF